MNKFTINSHNKCTSGKKKSIEIIIEIEKQKSFYGNINAFSTEFCNVERP